MRVPRAAATASRSGQLATNSRPSPARLVCRAVDGTSGAHLSRDLGQCHARPGDPTAVLATPQRRRCPQTIFRTLVDLSAKRRRSPPARPDRLQSRVAALMQPYQRGDHALLRRSARSSQRSWPSRAAPTPSRASARHFKARRRIERLVMFSLLPRFADRDPLPRPASSSRCCLNRCASLRW